MFGPGDFSVLAGVPYQFDHAILVDAIKRVAAAAKKAGIHWGTVSPTPEHTSKLMDLGARFICHNADIVIVKRGLEQIQSQFAPLGFTFENQLATMAAELERNK
jgi:4-hydroxy-2-oxoheptanedioate aldolase